SYALYASDSAARPAAYANTGGNDQNATGPTSVPAGQWTHLAATYDGAALRLYVNGALAATRAVAGGLVNGSGPLDFGGNGLWGEYFQARIDDAYAYSLALA